MLAVFDVHLVADDPWWQQIVGPALIAATAIVAAWIAARTANKRQEEQLKHDRELQAEQLAYDREQRDRADVRAVIDEAVKGVDSAVRDLSRYAAAVIVGSQDREEHRQKAAAAAAPHVPLQPLREAQLLKDEIDELHRLSQSLYDTSTDLTSAGLRLTLRLGANHKIVKAHDAFTKAIGAQHELLNALHHRPITEDDRKAIAAADSKSAFGMTAVFHECRNWLSGT